MQQAARILIVASAEAGLALALVVTLGEGWVAAGLGLLALHTGTIGVAVATRRTWILGKRQDGSQSLLAWIPFAPWLILTRGLATLVRHVQPPYSEVLPGWWVGGWPHRPDLFAAWPAVLDLTCELPRRHHAEPYLCLPTWDQTAPDPDAFAQGARFLALEAGKGRAVLVHCAAGRGRSVAVLCAGLVEAGHFPTWEEAYAHVRRVRPAARLTAAQAEALTAWAAARRA